MIERITSAHNPRVVAARRLQRRPARDREGAFLVEGRTVVAELLASPLTVTDVFVADGAGELEGVVAAAEAGGCRVTLVPERVLGVLAATRTPQGVVAVARLPAGDLPERPSLVLVLADVRDPGNAGTLVRTARAAGADAVVFARGAVDPFHPKTVRAAAGALFHLPVVRGAPVTEALEELRRAGLAAVGSDAAADTPYDDVDLTAPVALVLGNEAWGLPEEVAARLDHVVAVPMPGPMESLNVAVAGAVLLFEAVRQRRRR